MTDEEKELSELLTPTEYEIQTYKGRIISDRFDKSGYVGSCSLKIHISQMRDPKSWVHSCKKSWEEAYKNGYAEGDYKKEIEVLRKKLKELSESILKSYVKREDVQRDKLKVEINKDSLFEIVAKNKEITCHMGTDMMNHMLYRNLINNSKDIFKIVEEK